MTSRNLTASKQNVGAKVLSAILVVTATSEGKSNETGINFTLEQPNNDAAVWDKCLENLAKVIVL